MENKDQSQYGGYPQGGYPQGGYFQGGYPQEGYPPTPQPEFQPGGNAGGYGEGYNIVLFGAGSCLSGDRNVKGLNFKEQSIRKLFIRKVYSIFVCQLLVILAFITLFVYHTPTNIWVKQKPYLFWLSLVIMLVCHISMACCCGMRRRAPNNFIFLGIFTTAEGFFLGVSSISFNIDAVMITLGITAAVCLALTLFSLQTKWDFTAMRGVLLCAIVVLLMFGIIAMFVRGRTATLIFTSLGALIFSLYLILVTQLMMGGKFRYSLAPEEYIFAALNLYLDVFRVIFYLLTRCCR